MGIPKFFRWLTRRYPAILQQVNSEDDIVPVDNLYLDLNGIVHNCVHGNDPKRHERISRLEDLEELWAAVMRSIDELVHMVKPKKMIFLAVDGVAPRAKMNQQRARRFRSARERAVLKQQIEAQGKSLPELFDSNAISPGTKFMNELSRQLHFFVKYKVNTDPLYKNLENVVLSDASVPGEGEHKMLDYIRQARRNPNYDANTRHCFYGADADLIMLALLTHEPHFTIIREEHVVKRNKAQGVQRIELSMTANFQLIHISLLREYFMLEFQQFVGKLRFRFNLERIIDDFVFFCFFIGNDFLPSLSALDIAEGSLDELVKFYKELLPTMTDYITDSGVIHWDRAEAFIQLLGSHEHEVFKNRIDQIDYRRAQNQDQEKIVSINPELAQMLNRGASGCEHTGREESSLTTYNAYKDALFSKKKAKVQKLANQKAGKKYKKFLIIKRFSDEEEGREENLNQIPPLVKLGLNKKLQALYQTQLEAKQANLEETKEDAEESKVIQLEGLELIGELDAEYLSDLKPEDIPDDCVSDVDENIMQSLEDNKGKQENNQIQNLLTSQVEFEKLAEEQNRTFVQDFVSLYSTDADAAKTKYYKDKVGFDISTEDGKKEKKRMLKKYLEGMQWVLFYYYYGAKHWRWYYPYHYAPMISDLGSNIVREFLDSKTCIHEFEIDSNCPPEKNPYTPFQQLLAIMPLKSFKLLPDCYRPLAEGTLQKYFPEDFAIDLNGKTLAWEAIVLIPFIDEALFLEQEKTLMTNGKLPVSEAEHLRNNCAFTFFSYRFDPHLKAQTQEGLLQKKSLKSTLTSFRDLSYDYSSLTLNSEYETVGQESFKSMVSPKAVTPCPGYPTFKTLSVINLFEEYVAVQGVDFLKFSVMIPQCKEETQPEELEAYLNQYKVMRQKEVYVDFPYQHEAYPIKWEDMFTVYTVNADLKNNKYTILQQPQQKTEDEWFQFVERTVYKLRNQGVFINPDDCNVLVTMRRMVGVKFCVDKEEGAYYQKQYDDSFNLILPFSIVMQKRSPQHYLNVDKRILSPEDEVSLGSEIVCTNLNMFGLVGQIEKIEKRRKLFVVKFDKEMESSKVHDPFMAKKHMKYLRENSDLINQKSTYFGDQELDIMLQLEPGSVQALTSSFMLKYKNPETRDRVLVDIGLNLKNWQKKQHIPRYVRFVTHAVKAEDAMMGEFTTKGNRKQDRHVRSHWEYSSDVFEILKQYKEQFPEVFEGLITARNKKSMPDIKDLFGKSGDEQIQKVKSIAKWLDSLPMASLPFVDIGFDTLTPEIIASINDHRENVEKNFENISLQTKVIEKIPAKCFYMERTPFWCPMFTEAKADSFKIGDRVMNIDSSKRQYVPFGLRGTVVGRTDFKIIVMFDEQFLQGSDINGHCQNYRGAIIDPSQLMNITRKFETQQRKGNIDFIKMFTEKDPNQPDQANFEIEEEEKVEPQPEQQPIIQSQSSGQKGGHQQYRHPQRPQRQVGVRPNLSESQQTKPKQNQQKQFQFVPKQGAAATTTQTSEVKTQVAKPAQVQRITEIPEIKFAPINEALLDNPDYLELMNVVNAGIPSLSASVSAPVTSNKPQNMDPSASTSQSMQLDPEAAPFTPQNSQADSIKSQNGTKQTAGQHEDKI